MAREIYFSVAAAVFIALIVATIQLNDRTSRKIEQTEARIIKAINDQTKVFGLFCSPEVFEDAE